MLDSLAREFGGRFRGCNHDRIKWQPSSGLGGNHGSEFGAIMDRIMHSLASKRIHPRQKGLGPG